MPPHTHSLYTRMLLAFVALFILTFSLSSLVQQAVPVAASSAPTPKLSVSPSSFTNCSICVATLTNLNTVGQQWIASSTTSGIAFTPSHGTLPPNGMVSVTITVTGINCPASATFLFNRITVPWSCSPTPTPSPSPLPTLTPTSTPGMTPTPTPGTATPAPVVGTPTATPTPQSTPISSGSGTSSTPVAGGTAISSTTQTTGNNTHGGGNPPANSLNGSIFTLAALFLALIAFVLYLIPQQSSSSSLRDKLLSLVLPASLLRRLRDR